MRRRVVSRILALSLLLGPFVVPAVAFINPVYTQWAAQGHDIRLFKEDIVKLDQEQKRLEYIENTYQQWQAFVADPASGFTQKDLPDATEVLLSALETLFAKHEGLLDPKTTDTLENTTLSDAIAIDLKGKIPARRLPYFLAELEQHTPFLIVDHFSAQTMERDAQETIYLALAIKARIYRLVEN